MRFINKLEAPDSLLRFQQSSGASYKGLTNNQALYKETKQRLVDDQFGLCCYCGGSIELNSCHIEHLQDQARHKELQLEFSNFLASCNGGSRQEHCGHAKGHQILPVTPLQEGCEQHFVYQSDGFVRAPEGDDDARSSVDVMNLNIAKLKNQRKAALAGAGLFDEELNADDLSTYIELFNVPDGGQLEPFSQVIVSRLKQELTLFH